MDIFCVNVCFSTVPINAVSGSPCAVHPRADQLAPKFSLFPSDSLALPSRVRPRFFDQVAHQTTI